MNRMFANKIGEQGMTSILVVIGFIAMCLSVLSHFTYHYKQAQKIVMQELEARQVFLFAQSALQWGLALDWDLSSLQLNKWQCHTFHANSKIKSCLLLIALDKALLQGQTENKKGYKIYHYQWVNVLKEKRKPITIYPNGWLDYCPLTHKECVS